MSRAPALPAGQLYECREIMCNGADTFAARGQDASSAHETHFGLVESQVIYIQGEQEAENEVTEIVQWNLISVVGISFLTELESLTSRKYEYDELEVCWQPRET